MELNSSFSFTIELLKNSFKIQWHFTSCEENKARKNQEAIHKTQLHKSILVPAHSFRAVLRENFNIKRMNGKVAVPTRE